MTANQTITPELRQWIIAQAQAGHPPDAVLAAMRASGWTEDTALAAMETTLQGHLAHQAPAQVPVQALPPAVPVPGPDLAASPLYLDAGDRRVQVLLAMENPRIVVFGDVISDAECEELIAQARPRMARSLTVARSSGMAGRCALYSGNRSARNV